MALACLCGCASAGEGDGAAAGTGAAAGFGAAAGTGAGAAGTGAGGIGAAGVNVVGGTGGTGAGGVGVAGTGIAGIGASGTGAAGTGIAGIGASGTGAGGTGVAGIGASGTGAGGTGASGTGASGTGASGTGGGGVGGGPPPITGGDCCSDGNCICRGEPALTSRNGSFRVESVAAGLVGTIFYPADADPPLAGLAIIPGFVNTGPEMRGWCEFYASHGIVCVMTSAGALDIPQIRATHLATAIDTMKQANMDPSSPLYEKMSGRYATSGYSMGGGGTTIASGLDSTLAASVGLAAWGGVGQGVEVPTLLLCGSSDTVAACIMSAAVYSAIPASTPKMMVTCSGATHFVWFDPTSCSGPMALAFMKRFLENDERWGPLLHESVTGASVDDTNIQ